MVKEMIDHHANPPQLLDTDTLIVGCGQAGLAMSAHLTSLEIPHLILERNQITENWRSRRWDSLVANGPAWHDRFPDQQFDGEDPDSFPTKDKVTAYFEEFSRRINAPVLCGIEVKTVTRRKGQTGFRVFTSKGNIIAQRVVVATGPFQVPVIPPMIPSRADIFQIHSAEYRNPDQLPEGSVLVVGAGSSGAQIAEDLCRAGRKVYLSIGPHHRPPRQYRGRDYCWWLGVLGKWDMAEPAPGTDHITISVSGVDGGKTVDFRQLAKTGITLLGMTDTYENGQLRFADDLGANIAAGDADYLALLDEADAYIAENGIDLPEDPEARQFEDDPPALTNPILNLDLHEANIRTVLWATGYRLDFGWLQVNTFNANGQPCHQRGVSSKVSGIYFLGLPWLSRRGSSFIWGVWHDARYIAEQISIQRNYLQFSPNRINNNRHLTQILDAHLHKAP